MSGYQKTLAIIVCAICLAIAAEGIGCVAYCGVQP
jgi:hypothetical protein